MLYLRSDIDHTLKVFIDDFGTFATAIGIVAAQSGNDVTFRIKPFDYPHLEMCLCLQRIGKNYERKRENNLHLPGVVLPENIGFTDMYEGAESADVIMSAVPSKYLEENITAILPYLKKRPATAFVLLTKGIDARTMIPWGEKLRRDLASAIGFRNFAVLSGYTPARDLAVSQMSWKSYAASVASSNLNTIKLVRRIFKKSRLGILGTTDVMGISLGGVLKNAYAIGYGLLLGLSQDRTASEYLGQAHAEMRVFIEHFKAGRAAINSPAVKGDFYLTSVGEVGWESRNVAFGKFLAAYQSKMAIQKYASQNTVEGYEALNALWQIAYENKLNAPLLFRIHSICEYGASPSIILGQFKRQS